jgi:hypothetical protein
MLTPAPVSCDSEALPRARFYARQVVLADFGVSHRLAAAVEGAGESAVSAAGRAGTTLTGEGSPAGTITINLLHM